MEQRKDYIESQTDMIARVLKKILEKMFKLKNTGVDSTLNIVQEPIYTEGPAFTVQDLLQINDQLLVAMLTSKYGYNAENIKLLADILYEIKNDAAIERNCKRKALILYRHYLSASTVNVDYVIFTRVNNLETNTD